MRNLKKFLALVLAMMMVFSLMLTANADYIVTTKFNDDEDINEDYKEAIAVLQGMKIYEGENDLMSPDGKFTRAFLATLMYRVTGNPSTDRGVKYNYPGQFIDVPETHWANGYINFAQMSGWIHGVDETHFDPDTNVTGYHVLALLLQVMGYGKKGEFVGPNWKVYTVSLAREAGINVNLTERKLAEEATREEVAAMVFAAMQRPMVEYYAVTNHYVPLWLDASATEKAKSDVTTIDPDAAEDPVYTLGYKYWHLTSGTGIDAWGKPTKVWTGIGGPYAIFEYKLMKHYDKAVEECDVAADLNLTRDTPIYDGYIDGHNVGPKAISNDGLAQIALRDTTHYIGAQGRETYIYNYGTAANPSLWIVEINNWLAKVIDVDHPDPDHNNHPDNRTLTLEIYIGIENDGTNDTIKATVIDNDEKYNKGDYLIVNILEPVDEDDEPVTRSFVPTVRAADKAITGYTGYSPVADVKIVDWAQVLGSGTFEDWEQGERPLPDETTVSKKEYKDSDKFYLNYQDSSRSYTVLGDGHDNIIGLGVSTTNYMVIEAIAWRQYQSSSVAVRDGYALADLMLANGRRVQNVTIANIDGDKAVNTRSTTGGVPASHSVADDWTNNTNYYGHIFSYSINEDGTYNIDYTSTHAASNIDDVTKTLPNTYGAISKTQGQVLRTTDNGSNWTVEAMANDSTVYLVWNEDGTYTVYPGKDNAPDISRAEICYLLGDDGYADLVVIKGESSSRTFVALVLDNVVDIRSTAKGNGYYVYKISDGSRTTVYDDGYGNAVEKGRYNPDTKVVTAGTAADKVWFWVSDDKGADNTNYIAGDASNNQLTTASNGQYKAPGLYEFTVNDKDQITNMTRLGVGLKADADSDGTAGNGTKVTAATGATSMPNTKFAVLKVTTGLVERSVKAAGFTVSAGTVTLDSDVLNLNLATDAVKQKFNVSGTGLTSFTKDTDVPKNAYIIVAYTEVGSVNKTNMVSYLCVIDTSEVGAAPAPTPGGDTETPPAAGYQILVANANGGGKTVQVLIQNKDTGKYLTQKQLQALIDSGDITDDQILLTYGSTTYIGTNPGDGATVLGHYWKGSSYLEWKPDGTAIEAFDGSAYGPTAGSSLKNDFQITYGNDAGFLKIAVSSALPSQGTSVTITIGDLGNYTFATTINLFN